ncbi:MAG: TetR/AcrR family transcriptional regulator [Spirochaetales bacterium]|nr:TetR/AcrR family transcriptional regulator [Spirochaetales bacterium]
MDRKDPGYREKIINAATELIVEKGPRNTSLAAIADRVNISKGTLYYYYRTKSELIYDVTERHMDKITHEILQKLQLIKKGTAPIKILEMVFETVLEAQTRTQLHIYLLHEAITNNKFLKARFSETYQKWKYLFLRGLGDVLPDRTRTRTIAELILTCIDGTMIQTMLGIEHIPLTGIAEFLLRDYTELGYIGKS